MLRSSNELLGIWTFAWSVSTGQVETILLGSPVLTGVGSTGVVTGNVYWLLLVDGERENTVGGAE